MNRVDPHPRARRVSRTPREVRDDAQRAIAAAFHVSGGGLTQQRQVARQPLGMVALDAPEAVEM